MAIESLGEQTDRMTTESLSLKTYTNSGYMKRFSTFISHVKNKPEANNLVLILYY